MNGTGQFWINEPVLSAGVHPWVVSVWCSQTSSANLEWINFSTLGIGWTVLWLQPSFYLSVISHWRYLSFLLQWDYFDTWQHRCCHRGRATGQWSVLFSRNITCSCRNSPALTISLAVFIPLPVKLRPSRLHLDQKCVWAALHFSCLLGALFFLWPSAPSPEGIMSGFSFFSTFCTALHLSHWPWPSPFQLQVTPTLCNIC